MFLNSSMAAPIVASRRQGDEILGHDAAGRPLLEFQELLDGLSVGLLHGPDELLLLLLGQVGQDVGGLVGLHLLEDVRDLLLGGRLDQGELELGVDLLEGLGGRLQVQHLEDRRPVGLVQLLDDVGEVRRVELVELAES